MSFNSASMSFGVFLGGRAFFHEADSVRSPERFFLVFLRFSKIFLGKSCFFVFTGTRQQVSGRALQSNPQSSPRAPRASSGLVAEQPQGSPKVAPGDPQSSASAALGHPPARSSRASSGPVAEQPQGSPRDPQSSTNAALEHPESILRTGRRAAPR